MEVKKIGVVGAGLMGSGIAHVCAQNGYQTVVSEINQQLLEKGLASIKTNMAKAVEKGKMVKADMDAALGRLRGTINTQDFRDCDLVIEAATENIELKKKIFTDLDRICPPNCVLATNTSCLSVLDVAMTTRRPEKVLGMHFFNPVPAMKLLELVGTIATSEETLNVGKAVGQSLGKVTVIAKDSPAFIVNRLLIPYLLDAIRMLETGYATKEDIDQAVKLGLNYPMGPFELLDFVGLDVTLFISSAVYDELKDPKLAPPLLLKKMVTAGRFGRKTGKGFYEYK